MKAARAHHICPRLTTPFKLQALIMLTHTTFAAHIAIIVKSQSRPPMTIPLTGYASPLKTCVTSTAGKITLHASCTATLVVRPRKTESLCKNVVNERVEATPPPIKRDVLMRWRTILAFVPFVYVVVSASSRLHSVLIRIVDRNNKEQKMEALTQVGSGLQQPQLHIFEL